MEKKIEKEVEEIKGADKKEVVIRKPIDEFDAAYGCVVGAFCGDALGGPLEFQTGPIKESTVNDAMAMKGRGPHHLQPGQVTDDSEMALCVAHGINIMEKPNEEFDLRKIVKFYSDWYMSYPFDMGATTTNALQYSDPKDNPDFDPSKLSTAAKDAADSQSNGCLMRSTPLGVYVSKIEDDKKLANVVISEISLTHANKDVQVACVCYCIAIRELIRNWDKEDKREKAYEAAENLAKTYSKTVAKWFITSEEKLPDCNKQIAWAKIAFAYAFFYLKYKKMEYEKAIREVVTKGGDTDTNAAIVGGLLGAAEGFSKLPAEITKKMLECDSVSKGHKRPEFLCPQKVNLRMMIKKIFDNRPTDPKIIP